MTSKFLVSKDEHISTDVMGLAGDELLRIELGWLETIAILIIPLIILRES